MCLLSCQCHYTYETCKHCAKKKLYITILISLLKLLRSISEYHFSGERVLLNSIMGIHCSTAEGGADQNWMAVDMRGEAVKLLHLTEVMSE